MRVWLGLQFVGALLSAIGGVLVALAAKSAIHEIEAALLIGFGSLVMAAIGASSVAEDQAKEQATLLREIRDAMRDLRLALPASAPEANAMAPHPTPRAQSDPGPRRATAQPPVGMKYCSACSATNWSSAKECKNCAVAFPPGR